ncbi:MAG TPA: DUF5916 domain-containing protein [Gemmatimonadales bacterium]|jgi:hypothetical protein|nr:DUF5916 domain-containing protein [Gemmatimonadales bacterium]
MDAVTTATTVLPSRASLLACLALAAPHAVPVAAQCCERMVPHLRVGRLTAPLTLDGRLDEPAWAAADSIGPLTQVTPVEGATPASRTVVKVLAGSGEIVFGIVAYGAPGVPITSFNKARDFDPDDEDYLGLVLDTFRDGRSGYVFVVNPNGARADGLVVRQGESTDESWDGIWEAATARSGNSWSAEIRIPIRSLIFRKGLTSWGFNIARQVKATQETTRWASPVQNATITQMSRAGLLDSLPDFSLGLGLSIRPAAVMGGGHPGPDTELDGTAKPSLDVTQRLGANLLGSATVNTDFAETDVDTRRTNFTRFPLFFPEKRTFFLEGMDIFEFGPNLGQDVIPFFSRRIGLLEGMTVPLRVGGKLNGRAGQTNFGALVTRTGHVDTLTPANTLGALRVRQNVLNESSLGGIVTFGDPEGRRGAWTGGADAIYHTSRFRGGKNLTAGIWAARAGRDSLPGDRDAYGLLVDYPNDVWDVSTSVKHIGAGFDPSLGFVPRQGINRYRLGIAWQPRPHRWGIRQMFFEQEYVLVTNPAGLWQSYQVFLAPVNWRFESGDRIEANVIPQGERLDAPFEVAEGVVIPPGAYDFVRYRLEAELAARRTVSGQLTWRFGGFYAGHLHQIEFEGAWKPSASFILELEGEHDIGRLREGDFAATLVGLRALVNVSPDLNLSSFVQYDTDSRTVGSNTRLRWTFRPAGDLFLVYNHNVKDLRDGWQLQSNQLLAKIQYALRY